MPSLQEIRQFNHRLITMGDEPQVVLEWGEELEEVPVPETGLDEDLSSMLSDTGELAASGEEEPSEDEETPDCSEVLADEQFGPEPDGEPEPFEAPDRFEGLDEEAEASEEFAEIEPAEEIEPTEDEAAGLDEGDFSDFAALLGDHDFESDADEELEVFEEPDEEPDEEFEAPSPEEPSGEPQTGPTDEEELFGEFSDEGADDLFGLPDDLSFEIPEDDESEATALDEDVFALPEGGFSLEDEEAAIFGASEEEGGEEAEGAESPEEPQAPEEPDFGDLVGFEFSDEETLEEPGAEADEFSFEEPAVPGAEDVFGEAGGLDEVGDEDLDEFSLGDFGTEFGVLEEGPSEEDLNPAINVPEVSPGVPAAATGGGEFRLSEDEFRRLQRHLSELPLNVKQETEAIVAEARGTPQELENLCRMLAGGAGVQEIANLAGRILGKRIPVPRGYEKRTGEQFEQERTSFAYQFRENVWPILRLAMVALVAAGALALAGYHLVYRPLYARSLYVDGLDLIESDQYSLGNQTFARAWEVWADSDWYYDYAAAFIDERQYSLAEQKYEELLFGRVPEVRELARAAIQSRDYGAVLSNHEVPRRGVLEYADLESRILGNYERADRLLGLLLFRDLNDYDARLALGDNYMRWADEDPSRYEDARLAYARLIERYGQTDELLFRMLRYFIATDNLQEAVAIKNAFQADPRARIHPVIYAELAGYLIDNELLGDVEDVIFRALGVDSSVPELHYELARYYRAVFAIGEEELALRTARQLLADSQPFTADRRAKLVDTHTRIGENQYDAGNSLDAQESFTRAIELYDQGRERRILGPDPELARAYARLGDVFYYIGRDFDQALNQFDRAERAGYRDPDLDYKQGYVHYREGRVDLALEEFRQSAEDPSAATNALLWATANTHFRRANLFASEAYYRELIDRVERERDSIRTLLVDEDRRHQSVIEYMFRGYNNLGVALHELSQQTGDPRRYSQSLVYFTRSTELAENYRRDPRTLSRSDAVDLAYLNQREALYPRPDYEMQIYIDIPEDLDDLLF